MDSISALSASLAMYGVTPAADSSAASDVADGAAETTTDIGPAASLMLSSLNMQSQMVSTLFGASPLGRFIDVTA
jgi:hypothetical protein